MPHLHAPRRIACLQPSATVILESVGALERVVACTKYCVDVVAGLDVSGRLVIADSWSAKTEEILAARPDLVIAAVPYQQEAVAEILKAGVRFLGLAPRALDDIYADIAVIGGCVGASERAESVIRNMQMEIDEVRARAVGLAKRRVFCEEWGKPIIASQPWVAELVQAAGENFWASRAGSARPMRWLGGSGGRRCGVVRGWRSRSSGENYPRARVGGDGCGAPITGVLHLRRVAEYSRAHAGCRVAGAGGGDSSRDILRGWTTAARNTKASIYDRGWAVTDQKRAGSLRLNGMALASQSEKHAQARTAVDRLRSEARSADGLMKGIVVLLNEQMLKYNWVGFYMLEPGANPPVLVLGHYQGAMTPHTRIPLHEGICGAAATTGTTVNIDDVAKDPRYLACSIETKSEIVAPIFRAWKSGGRTGYRQPFSGRIRRRRPRTCRILRAGCWNPTRPGTRNHHLICEHWLLDRRESES